MVAANLAVSEMSMLKGGNRVQESAGNMLLVSGRGESTYWLGAPPLRDDPH